MCLRRTVYNNIFALVIFSVRCFSEQNLDAIITTSAIRAWTGTVGWLCSFQYFPFISNDNNTVNACI